MKKWKLVSALTGAAAVCAGTFWFMQGPTEAVQAAADPENAEEAVVSEEAAAGTDRIIDPSVRVLPGARIAVVSKSTKGEFWEKIREGMSDAVDDLNNAFGFSGEDKLSMTFEGSKDEMDVDTQINTLDAVISENPDVLCLCAGDMDSCLAQLEAAEENGIPVVVFDSTVAEDDLISAYRGTDNVAVGKIAARKLADEMSGQGEILVFSATEKSATVRSRVAGFLEELAEWPDITLIDVIYQDQVEDLGTAIQETLEAHPGARGIYCTNGDTADLFLSIEKNEDNHLVIVGTDGTKEQVKAIEEGRILGCVSQKAWQIGYDTMLAAAALTTPVNLTKVERDVYMDPMWIDGSNYADPEMAGYIYQ